MFRSAKQDEAVGRHEDEGAVECGVDRRQPPTRLTHQLSGRVTEIELGGSTHLGAHATLSAGYFWSAWHDLGMSPTTNFGNAFQISHYDDANILGWNGLFGRVEVAF